MSIAWMNRRGGQILIHSLAWIIVFSLPYLLLSQYDQNRPRNPDASGFFYLNTITDLLWIGLFYLNAHLLVARLIYKKKYAFYLLSLLFFLALIMLIHGYLFTIFIHTHDFVFANSLAFNLPTFGFITAASTTYQMVRDRGKADRVAKEKQEENLKTELSFLRSQISPHFMFNVLNNLIALIRMKSDQLEPTVFKLSSLMRYMIYETDEKKVSLQKEIEYLRNYIDLQQLRFGDKIKMNVNLEAPPENFEIEPMLLIPFIENAFKHGTGYIQKPQIDIELAVKNSTINFSVRNKYGVAEEQKDESSGIGLANVKRRLNLLYENQHELSIVQADNWFTVLLQLKLHA